MPWQTGESAGLWSLSPCPGLSDLASLNSQLHGRVEPLCCTALLLTSGPFLIPESFPKDMWGWRSTPQDRVDIKTTQILGCANPKC